VWTAADLAAMALAATPGNDRIVGTSRADNLSGGAGDDQLSGLTGDDSLSGGAGVDLLEGGEGNDVYRFGRGDGQDRISDSGGSDAIAFADGILPADIRVSQSSDGSRMILSIVGGNDRIAIEDALAAGRMEAVRFASGTSWSLADLIARVATFGDDTLTGDGEANNLAGGLGNDRASGKGGDDLYRFARGDGFDILDDGANSSADRLEISGYGAAELRIQRPGFDSNDIAIRFAGSDDAIHIVDVLAGNNAGIEIITLADGSRYTVADLRALVLSNAATEGDDVVIGTGGADSLTGGKGSDLLSGAAGDDTYIYRKGDGDDRIDAFGFGRDIALLPDYNVSDLVSALRAGPDSDDLVLLFREPGDRLVLREVLGSLNAFSWQSLALQFKDGTLWERDAMRARALADVDGGGNDNVYGFSGNDRFAARPGNDWLAGDSGSDSYVFSRGSGMDTIQDRGSAALETDSVVFSGIASTDVAVARLFRGSESVVFSVPGASGDSLTVIDALAADGQGIESYSFADGVTWTKASLRSVLDNLAPQANDDGYYSTLAGQPLLIPASEISRNDFDADGDSIRIVAVFSGPEGSACLTPSGDIQFSGAAGFYGPARLTYTLSDGRNGFATASIDVRVRPVATAYDDGGFTVAEDGTLTIRAVRLLGNDLDGDRLLIGQVFGASHGSVSLSSDGNISFSPTANYNGLAGFSYSATTPEGARAEAKVLISVTPVNDAPLARDDAGFVTAEGTSFTILPSQLTANDTDVDADLPQLQSVVSSPNLQAVLGQDNSIRLTPQGYFFGSTYFDYTISDGAGGSATGRVSVSVTPVNDPPDAQDDRFETTQAGEPIREDNPIVLAAARLLVNDSEFDGEPLNLIAVRNERNGSARLLDNATVLFTPVSNFFGEASFEYQISDGHGGSDWATASIVYSPVNDLPVTGDDHYSDMDFYFLKGKQDQAIEIAIIELLKNDFDPEGFALSFNGVFAPINGEVSLTDRGSVLFTPDPGYAGEASFHYGVQDIEGGVFDAVVTLFFQATSNAKPQPRPDTVYVYEDVPTTIHLAALLGNDSDVDGDALSFLGWRHLNLLADFSTFGPDAAGPLNGTLAFDANGDLLFTPSLDATFASGFIYAVTDIAQGSSEGFADIRILPSNDDPTAVDDSGFTTPRGIPLVIRVSDLLFNDFDIEQIDGDGDGRPDLDLDDPNRPRPNFVGIDGIFDPAQLAFGHQVAVGQFELASFQGEIFLLVRFDEAFSGPLTIQYRIADDEGREDVGFASATVADRFSGHLVGTPRVDYLLGGSGPDRIESRGSADAILAMAGDDTISAGSGVDDINAGPGDDCIDGGDDGDRIDGGSGFDTVQFSGSNAGVRADLETRVGQGGFAEGDVYLHVEGLIGTEYNDELGGNGFANRLEGWAGRDRLLGRNGDDTLLGGSGDDNLEGGPGADLLDGGDGQDTASWLSSKSGGVRVSLEEGSASGGDAEGDLLVSIEHLIGSDFADVLGGDGGSNRIEGGRGDDQLFGGAGDDTFSGGRGADTVDGGNGLDTVDFSQSPEGVVVDLFDNMASRGEAAGDVFRGIEIIQGSYHDDSLLGNGSDNRLRGGRGADLIDGRDGSDTADYSTADEYVIIDLALGQGFAGEAFGDILRNIEGLRGSAYADQLLGSSADEFFDGGFGDDTVAGGAGSDRYVFGPDSASDTISEQGHESDIDRVMLSATIAPKDVSLLLSGDDLVIELERDGGFLIDTLTVKNHALGAASGIEEIVFDDRTVWDRDRIAALIRLGRFNAVDDIYRFGIEDELASIDPAHLIENDAENLNGLSLIFVGNARFGTVAITSQGYICFLGAKDHNGDAFFDYTVRDGFGRESTATVEVNLAPVNDAPVAVDDPLVYGVEDQLLRIRLDTLLANDFDIDGEFDTEELCITGFAPLLDVDGNALYPYQDAKHGRAATNAAWRFDGSYVEFKPRPDFFGSAGFLYTVSDTAGATATASVEIYLSPVNDAPRARDSCHEVRLSQSKTFSLSQLMQEVVDIEGDAFSFVGLHIQANGSAASNGEVAFDATAGTISFTPHGLGEAAFYYDVIDSRGAEATLELNLMVRPLNDPPKAYDDYGFRTLEDTTLLIDPATLFANDKDENGDVLRLGGLARFTENGKVRLNEAGLIEFQPRADYNGAAGFEYTVTDGRGGSDVGFVHITVLPSNAAPLVRPDVVAGTEDQPLGVIPAEAFGNDSDPEGDVIFFRSAKVLGALSKGYLSAGIQISAELADGSPLPEWLRFDCVSLEISGTPPWGFDKTLAIDLWVNDPETGSSFNTRLHLAPSALAGPVRLDEAVLGRFIIRSAHTTALEFGGLPLDLRVSVTARGAAGAALPDWLRFDAASLSFSGTPPIDAPPLEITLRFSLAGDGTTPVYFEKTVFLDPASLASAGGTIPFDSDIALFEVRSGVWSAGKAGGQPLPDWLRFDPLTRQLAFSGFAPEMDDQPARVQIVFTPTAPVLAKDEYAATYRGFALEFLVNPHQPIDPAINRLLTNPAFFQAQGLFALDLSAAAQITAARESHAPLPAWLQFDAESLRFSGMPPAQFVGAVPVRLDITGQRELPSMSVITQVVVDPTYQVESLEGLSLHHTNERIQISAPQDFNGALAILYRANDEKGAVSEPTTIVVTVKPAPERPDAHPDTVEVEENGSVTLPLSALLTNDFDRDNDSIRILGIAPPATGTLEVIPGRMEIAPPAALPALTGATWTAALESGAPLPDWLSLDTASGLLSGAAPIEVRGDLAIRFTRTFGAEGNSATRVVTVDGNAGALLRFTPQPNFSGEVPFNYTLTDDRQGTNQGVVTVNVLPRLEPPTAKTDRFNGFEDTPLILSSAALLANDSDVDRDPIRFVGAGNGQHGSVRIDGTDIVFTPDANFAGLASFEYQISDDRHGSSAGLVEIQFASTNRSPMVVADRFAGHEDVPVIFTAADLLANDSDPDGDEIRFMSLRPDAVKGRIDTLPGGRYRFVPLENATGDVNFMYTISDGRANASGSFSFNLDAVNDAPIANSDGIFFGKQDTPLRIDFASLVANDRDVESDSFQILEVFDSDNGEVMLQGEQAVFIGRSGYFGDAGFHYRLTDVHGASSVGFVQLTILPNVPLPIGVSDWGFELLEDSSLEIDPNALLANDVAPAGTTLSFAGFDNDDVTLLGNGRWQFIPERDYFGPLRLPYFITNESGFPIPTVLEIEVLPVADEPEANDDRLTLIEDEAATIFITSLLANDRDVDKQAIALTRLFDAVGLKVVDNGIGQLLLTPERNFTGEATFSYEISDSSGLTATARVQVEVKPVNDAPVIQLLPVINALEDISFTATLPQHVASDADGDLLLLEARGLGATSLPEWLRYDRQSASFSGVPPKDFHGTMAVELAAFDGQVEIVRQVTIVVAPVNDAPTGQVSISGPPVVGLNLTASHTLADAEGIPSTGPGVISYQWLADGSPIAGATGTSLQLSQALVGKAIAVAASYTDHGGTREFSRSSASPPVVAAVAHAGTLSFVGLTDSGSNATDGITNDDTFSLDLTGSSDSLGIAATQFLLSNDGGITWTTTSAQQTALASGTYHFRAVVTGIAGNSASSNVVAVVVDKLSPATTAAVDNVTEGAGGPIISRGGTFGGTAPLVVHGTISNALANGETLRLFDGNVLLGQATLSGTQWSYTDRRTLAAGQTIMYTARVEDSAGNLSAPANSYVVSLISSAPLISLWDVSVWEGNTGTTTGSFEVLLSRASNVPVSVVYQFIPLSGSDAASFGVDLTAITTSQLLTFPAGVVAQTIAFSVTGDTTPEQDESFRIQLFNPFNATLSGGGSSLTAKATILNDDAAYSNTISASGNFQGSIGDDVLIGLGEVNQIDGLAGNDTITGGPSADFLAGGPGADVFVYTQFSDSTLAAFDTITDFNTAVGDKIDLPTRPTSLFNRGAITASNLFAAMQAASAIPSDSSSPRALMTNEAMLFTWGMTPRNRSTYLAISDGVDVNFNGDLLIRLPANPGSIDMTSFV
jgi:Ca2+-binding RTX toxin-like protein